MSKKSYIIIFGIICIILGLGTDFSNFIPAIFKYIVGIGFILYALFFIKKSNDNISNESD